MTSFNSPLTACVIKVIVFILFFIYMINQIFEKDNSLSKFIVHRQELFACPEIFQYRVFHQVFQGKVPPTPIRLSGSLIAMLWPKV